MEKKEILIALACNDYSIFYDSNCGCTFNWQLNGEGQLIDGCDTEDCWESNTLYIDGEKILWCEKYGPVTFVADGIKEEDIPVGILGELQPSGLVFPGESGNSVEHDNYRRWALEKFVTSRKFELDRNEERGFANEYTMILRDTGNPVESTQEEVEKWVEAFLYSGDATTAAMVGFSFELEY